MSCKFKKTVLLWVGYMKFAMFGSSEIYTMLQRGRGAGSRLHEDQGLSPGSCRLNLQ